MRRRSFSPLAIVLVSAVAVGVGCSDARDDTTTDAKSDTTNDTTVDTVVLTSDGRLRIRPVVTLLPIDGLSLNPFGDDDPAAPIVSPNIDSSVAYDLGPSVVEEADVADATATRGTSGEWRIDVTLTDAATVEVRELAAICLALDPLCERGQIAVTVDGFVVSAIPVVDTEIGPQIVLSGGLNQQQAEVIAASLAP